MVEPSKTVMSIFEEYKAACFVQKEGAKSNKRKRRAFKKSFMDAVESLGGTVEAAISVDQAYRAHQKHEDLRTKRSRSQLPPFASLMFENPKEAGALKTMEISSKPTPTTFVGLRMFVAQSTTTPTARSRAKKSAEGTFVFDPMDFDYADVHDREYMNARKGRILGSVVFGAAKKIVLTDAEVTDDTVLLDDKLARASRVAMESLSAGFERGEVKYAWPITEAKAYKNPILTRVLRAGKAGAVQCASTKEAPRRRLPPPVCERGK